MNTIKGILFDFNGTMVIDDAYHKEAWNQFSIKYRGHELSEAERKHILGDPNIVILKRFFPNTNEELLETYSLEKEAMYRELCAKDAKNYQLIDGLIQLLDELKEAKIPMLICSASIKDNIDFFIQTFHLEKWFDVEQIVYDDGTYINKKAMYIEGSKRINVALEHCLIFEDSLAGIENALALQPAKVIAIANEEKKQSSNLYDKVAKVIENYKNISINNL